MLAAIFLRESLKGLDQGQIRAVPSELAVATNFPSGLKAALQTNRLWDEGPPMALPVAASHTRAVLSQLARSS